MKLPSSEQLLYLANILMSRWVNAAKNAAAIQPQTILCVKYDEIGDVVNSTHIFALLKEKFPKATLHVLTKPYSAPLLEGNPHIDVVMTDIGAWKTRYDIVVEMRGTWRSLFKTLRYYPKLRFDRGWVRLQHRGNQLHEVETNAEIVKELVGDLAPQAPQLYLMEKHKLVAAHFISSHKLSRFAVIHAGARKALRRWPAQNFAALADHLQEQYGLQVVLAGIPEEVPQLQEIAQKAQHPVHLFTDGFSLLDLAALLAQAALFVGNESGPLQVADVMQTPLVALFGPGVPTVFYPRNPKSRCIHHILECNPCDQVHCKFPENTCMQRITQAEVYTAVAALLEPANANES